MPLKKNCPSSQRSHYIRWIKATRKAKKFPQFAAIVKEYIKRDPVYFFDNWLWTYDPRKPTKILPFHTFEYQEKMIRKMNENYNNREHLLVEKSRDMGFSWLVLGFMLWKALTDEGFSAGIGSRKASLVDDLGNMKSMLQRIRFMLSRLPEFLREGYKENTCSKLNLIMIPNTKATITGEAGDEIGRGDRTSMYLIDEFAFIPRSSQVQAAVSQTSDFICYGSTPNGKGNEFARLRFKTDIDVLTLHWKDHPHKDQAWYEKQKKYLDEATMAQEIDISYAKSTSGRVYKWFKAEKHANEIIEYDPNYPLFATFDWGIGDPTACLFLQDHHGMIRIVGAFEVVDKPVPQIFAEVASYLQKWHLKISDVAAWYGDPDGRSRNIVSGESVDSYIRARYNINMRFKLPNVIKNRVMAVRILGEGDRILIDKRLTHVHECFENYRYPDKDHGENEKPLHDWTSHTMSSLEYYCVFEHGMDQFDNNDNEITAGSWR